MNNDIKADRESSCFITYLKCLYTNACCVGNKQELEIYVRSQGHNLIAIAETCLPDQEEEADETFCGQLETDLCTWALVLLGDFNHFSSFVASGEDANEEWCVAGSYTNKPESNSAKKDLGVLVDDKLAISWQCSLLARKASRILGYIGKTVSSKSREIIPSLYSALMRPHVECSVLGSSVRERQGGTAEGPLETTKMVRDPEHLS
ncbi:hypothetical protein DUI87_16286 [Hirundo rustica rustica]|uniref:Endonuclease/exonuclease/phosphatase domain-containing protein n=1 Tax=Hirundo rustica rustica TaxID=333673 RepID=A0A3M0K1H5_HIRRU|nr:hypothetical protein DUI87_16286 [Hirundo rustica rustica]